MLTTALFLFLCVRTSIEAEDENVVIVSSTAATKGQPYFQLFGFPREATLHKLQTADSKALFGYSVASLHDARSNSFVAGAPKSGRRGEVFQCDYIDNGERRPKFSCDFLKFVGTNSANASDDSMFLGGSVSALSVGGDGYILYCGHLYKESRLIKNDSHLFSTGLCNLKRSGDNPIVINPCDGFTSCLSGFSSAMGNALDGNKILVGVGMPNIIVALGKSRVASVDRSPKSPIKMERYSHADHKSTYYTGFSIAFGRGVSTDALFVSTPLKITDPVEPKVEYFVNVNDPSNTKMDKFGQFTDDAKHLGGFYGLSLATISMSSGNQRSTLLVGEPFYSDFSANLMDVGRVYIYCLLTRNPLVLRGEKANSMFGYSIARIGDINDDNVIDFAVGCPYCDDGQGAVYIFLGHRRCLIGQPVQVIRASDVTKHLKLYPPLRGFGWSLSGETDFDKNRYLDLVIGTPFSNSVVLARSRSSVITNCVIKGSCKMFGKQVANGDCDGFDRNLGLGCSCENALEIELFISSKGKIELQDLNFNMTVDLDKEKKADKRVFNGPNGSSVFSRSISGKKKKKTITFTPMIDTKLFRGDMDTPIRVSVSWSLIDFDKAKVDRDGRLIPSPRLVSEDRNSKCEREIEIVYLICGGGVCKCDLILRVLLPPQTRFVPPADPQSSNVSTAILRVDYPIKNQTILMVMMNADGRDDAIRPGVTMYFRNGLRFVQASVRIKNVPIDCTAKDLIRVDCTFMDSESVDSEVGLKIEVDFSGVYTAAKDFVKEAKRRGAKNAIPPPPQFEAVTKTASRDVDPSNNRIVLNYTVVYRPDISLVSGQSEQTVLDDRNTSVYISKNARVYVDQVGPKFRHVYQLSNSGPSPAMNIFVNITIPVATENGDYLIYLFKEVRTGMDEGRRGLTGTDVLPRIVSESGQSVGECFVPPEVINPRGITVIETHDDHVKTILDEKKGNESKSENIRHRKRRSAGNERPKSAEPVRGGVLRQRNKEYIECGIDSVYLGRPRCVDIQCRIDKLPVNDAVRIIVDGWLWARTIVGRKISDIEIKTSGRGRVAGVPAGVKETMGLTFGPLNITTNFVFRNVSPPVIRQIPIWPIILGIILGILLLAAIIILLYKCGFFKRRRPKPQPEPQSHYVIDVSSPNDRNHHDMNQDSTPLIPKVKGPTSRKDSTDDLIEQEFADMERSILTSANEIEMRRKTEEDEEVDRLVRQVSTHEPVPSERPPSFPVDMWLTVAPTVSATTPDDEKKESDKNDEEKKDEEEEKKEDEETTDNEKQETEATPAESEEKKEEETPEEKEEDKQEEKEEDKQEEKEEDKQEEKEEDKQEEKEEDKQEEKEEEKSEEKTTEDSPPGDSTTDQPAQKSPAEASPDDAAKTDSSEKAEASQPASSPAGDER